ncbi:MAG TPA: hypothetical protein VEF33_05425 [Syntrophales bacterium]|nr:hypothetical protein [Syntrophales bacterium]
MEKTDVKNNPETLGVLETSILSAHMKYFKGNSETHYHPESEESVLYDTVIRYFTINS